MQSTQIRTIFFAFLVVASIILVMLKNIEKRCFPVDIYSVTSPIGVPEPLRFFWSTQLVQAW
jgi:hypothetical protein